MLVKIQPELPYHVFREHTIYPALPNQQTASVATGTLEGAAPSRGSKFPGNF